MASDQFVIDGICHPYNFSEENLRQPQRYVPDDEGPEPPADGIPRQVILA